MSQSSRAAHYHISARCSKYGETRRSGRISCGSTSSVYWKDETMYIPTASLLKILSSNDYTKRFVSNTNFVALLFPQTYNLETGLLYLSMAGVEGAKVYMCTAHIHDIYNICSCEI